MKRLKLSNVGTVARWEFFKNVASPSFLILTFLIPVIMLVAAGVGYITETTGGEPRLDIAVIDNLGDFYPYLEAHLKDSSINATLYEGEPEKLEQELLEGEHDYNGFIVINQATVQTGHIIYNVTDIRNTYLETIRREITPPMSIYRLEAMGFDEGQIAAALTPVSIEPISISGEEHGIGQMVAPIALGMVLIFAAIFSGQILMYGVIKEKQNRIVEILLSSISSIELMVGKIVGYGALSLLQIGIWATAGILVTTYFIDLADLGLSLNDFILPLVFFFFGYLLLSSIFATVGATMKEAEGGSQAQGLVVIIPMVPLFVSGPLIMNPDALWVRILSHIPPFIPATMLIRMGETTLQPWEIASTLTALILSVIFFIYIGARIFEGGILQYERAVTLRDLKNILKGSK